jgi:hypothetical protein
MGFSKAKLVFISQAINSRQYEFEPVILYADERRGIQGIRKP